MSRPVIRPWWLALSLAATSGVLLTQAFPAPGIWAAAPLALVLWFLVLLGRGFWSGLLYSLVASLAFWLTLISWLTLYLGPLPWAALSTLMALYMAVAGGGIALVFRWAPVLWPSRVGQLLLTPVLVASVWIARESFAASWPYGGYSWGRIAMSQTEGPFAGALSWFGASGLGWLIVALSAAAVQLWVCWRDSRDRLAHEPVRMRLGSIRQPLLGLAIACIALAALPNWPVHSAGSMRVLAVQGGVDSSLFTDLPRGAVLSAHADATLPYVDEQVDVVVWPENAADIDPLQDPSSAAVLDALSRRMQAPFLVGTITERNDKVFNSSVLWQYPNGMVDWYDKAHPVPFAEYMPDRAFWRPFAPSLIDLIGRDYTPGTRSNVLDVNGTKTGVAICFDIAYDNLIQEMIDGDAEVIFAQTNNADFGHTEESRQQLAIARMRALETGRSVVNISTVSSSAIIDRTGQTLNSLPDWTPGAMLESVPLATGDTLAMLWGNPLAAMLSWLGAAGVLLILVQKPRRRSPR